MRSQSIAQPEDLVALMVPRSQLTIVERPRAVSQRTSESVLGIPKRPFLELARDYTEAGGTVIHLGKLRVIELEPLLGWLAARKTAAPAKPAANDEIDDLAASLGLVVAPAKPRAR